MGIQEVGSFHFSGMEKEVHFVQSLHDLESWDQIALRVNNTKVELLLPKIVTRNHLLTAFLAFFNGVFWISLRGDQDTS